MSKDVVLILDSSSRSVEHISILGAAKTPYLVMARQRCKPTTKTE